MVDIIKAAKVVLETHKAVTLSTRLRMAAARNVRRDNEGQMLLRRALTRHDVGKRIKELHSLAAKAKANYDENAKYPPLMNDEIPLFLGYGGVRIAITALIQNNIESRRVAGQQKEKSEEDIRVLRSGGRGDEAERYEAALKEFVTQYSRMDELATRVEAKKEREEAELRKNKAGQGTSKGSKAKGSIKGELNTSEKGVTGASGQGKGGKQVEQTTSMALSSGKPSSKGEALSTSSKPSVSQQGQSATSNRSGGASRRRGRRRGGKGK